MEPEFKALALGNFRFKDLETEGKAVQHCLELLNHYRQRMGWRGEGRYEANSWLWKRYVATRMYEGDFSHRSIPGTLFGTSNLSMNMPKDFIDIHNNRTSDDLFGGDEFFGTQPEGPEDTSPGIKLYERYLQRRAKVISLRDTLNEAKKGAFIRGECFVKSTRKRLVQTQKRDVRILLQPSGEPARDSRGSLISELDTWSASAENPAAELLDRDQKVSRPAGQTPRLSEQTYPALIPVESTGGADISVPYWADVVFDINAPTLDSSFFAHVYEMYPDEIMDTLPKAMRTASADAWLALKAKSGSASGIRSDQMADVISRGERDEGKMVGSEMSFAPVLVAECYLTADLDGDGKRERVCMFLDLTDQSPITYEHTHFVMPWAPTRANPFGSIRINPIEKRIYGIGYYDELRDMHDYCDKNTNRLEVEIAKSGNLLFEDRESTEEGRAGRMLKFRTLDTWKKRGPTADGKPPVEVVTVTPQTVEIERTLDRTLQRLQTAKGSITPADSETAGLDAANTAKGMEILQRSSDVQLKARQAEILVGTNEVLGTFAEIEAESIDVVLAEKIFRPMMEAREKQAEAPDAEGQEMERQDLTHELQEWVEQNKDNIRQRVVVSMARKTPTQIIEQSKLVDETMAAWFQMPPQIQAVMKDTYSARLRALEVQNPDAMLVSLNVNEQQPTNRDPEQ